MNSSMRSLPIFLLTLVNTANRSHSVRLCIGDGINLTIFLFEKKTSTDYIIDHKIPQLGIEHHSCHMPR